MEGIIGIIITLFIVGLLGGGLWGCPQYNVYSSRLSGEAKLAEAEYSRQVAVREAAAKRDSASLLAEAEITRAGGVAKANQIIGESLKDNEAYLRYLFVSELVNTRNQVIYVPTEAQLPILESGRHIINSVVAKPVEEKK